VSTRHPKLHALTVAIAMAVGCASAPTLTTAPDPARMYGAVAHRTAFEEGQGAQAPVAEPAPVAGPTPRAPTDVTEPEKGQGARTGIFWAGVAATALGAAMLTGFGIGGRVTQAQLEDGYGDGDLSYAREEKLRDRGTVFNQVAGAGAGIAIVGIAVTAIVYGVDFSRCGTLAKRRKDCKSNTR